MSIGLTKIALSPIALQRVHLAEVGNEERAALINALFGAGEAGALYDPSDSSTCFQERTGASATTPAGADDPVGTILDLSGNGNHRTAPSDAARPIRRTDGTYWWLEHDGVDDMLFCNTASLDMQPPWALGIAMRSDSTNSSSTAPWCQVAAGALDYHALGPSNNKIAVQIRGANATPSIDFNNVGFGLTYAGGVAHVTTAQIVSGSVSVTADGVDQGSKAHTWTTSTLTAARIGAGARGLSVPPTVAFDEYAAVMCRKNLTAGQLSQLQQWLASKCGVTL